MKSILVLDTNFFIENQSINEQIMKYDCYTIEEVQNEIKTKKHQTNFRDFEDFIHKESPEFINIEKVIHYAKLTGDILSLS